MLDLAYNRFAVIPKIKMNLCTRANERINCGTVDPLTATRNLLMILRHGQEPIHSLEGQAGNVSLIKWKHSNGWVANKHFKCALNCVYKNVVTNER